MDAASISVGGGLAGRGGGTSSYVAGGDGAAATGSDLLADVCC